MMTLRVALVAVVWACSAPAPAQNPVWNNPAGGCWRTPGNWSPVALPNSITNVAVSLPGEYTVGFNIGTAACAQLSLTNPDATVGLRSGETLQRFGTTHQINGVLRVGDATFANPASIDAFVPSFLRFEGTGRIVLNAHPQIVLPFAVIRASGRPVTVTSGLRLEGRGAVQGDLTLQGTLAPGVGPGAIGELQVDRLILGASSGLEFDIAGALFGEADRLQVSFSSTRAPAPARARCASASPRALCPPSARLSRSSPPSQAASSRRSTRRALNSSPGPPSSFAPSASPATPT